MQRQSSVAWAGASGVVSGGEEAEGGAAAARAKVNSAAEYEAEAEAH